MFKMATVYSNKYTSKPLPVTMDTVRWIRISEAFARLGVQVDIIVNQLNSEIVVNENLRYISNEDVQFEDYDVIKTLFHGGFEFLMENDAHHHPFIISKLGSVVGSHDDVDGVYFYDDRRKGFFDIQKEIALRSKYVAILTDESIDLWRDEHGGNGNILKVPTGVMKELPAPTFNPYINFNEKIAVYIGNIYSKDSKQRSVNLEWQDRFNAIGRMLKNKGIRLCFIGKGEVDNLDSDVVTYLGAIDNNEIHNYLTYADVGIALAQGEIQHNESSKIYGYLRAGLPVVSEKPIPNNHLIEETGLGVLVDYNNNTAIAESIQEAACRKWNVQKGIDYMIEHHTWDKRVADYCRLVKEEMLCQL